MHGAERGSLPEVTSSKNTNGLCFAAYRPRLLSGHSLPSMPSWYVFHEIPAWSSSETKWSRCGR